MKRWKKSNREKRRRRARRQDPRTMGAVHHLEVTEIPRDRMQEVDRYRENAET